jgi:hypothetical protein
VTVVTRGCDMTNIAENARQPRQEILSLTWERLLGFNPKSYESHRPEDRAGLHVLPPLYVCLFWRREADDLAIRS